MNDVPRRPTNLPSTAEATDPLPTSVGQGQEAVGVNRDAADTRPALLVSYFYLDPFLKNRHRYAYRDWVMDSGAFSAHASGVPIDLDAYMARCLELMAADPMLIEVYALDVIGDWRASLANTERMWAAGIPAIPCYHVGEPESVLIGLARDYPKIALGGAVMYRAKDRWAAQCFARVWPKPIHGFGFGAEKSIMGLPWHSVDATNWEVSPCKYGLWASFGLMSVRGSKQNLRAEVEWHLALERRARAKWRPQMEQIAATPPCVRPGLGDGRPKTAAPTVRLSVASCGDHPAGRYLATFDLARSPSPGGTEP